jgi:hypothetical protein
MALLPEAEAGSCEYKVHRLIYENIESVLLANSRRYIAELAQYLEVNEKELIKKVLPHADSLKIMIIDSQAESSMCKAFVSDGKSAIYCRKPITTHSEYCSYHLHKRSTVVTDKKPIDIQKIKDINTLEPMWLLKETTTLVNSDGVIVGKVNHGQSKIKKFVVE